MFSDNLFLEILQFLINDFGLISKSKVKLLLEPKLDYIKSIKFNENIDEATNRSMYTAPKH